MRAKARGYIIGLCAVGASMTARIHKISPKSAVIDRAYSWNRFCRQSRGIFMTDSRTEEHEFYSRYSWCLNPVLSIKDLLRRFREEIDGYQVLSGWQREESKANLYLFACAVACTADDYFAGRWLDLKQIKKRAPRLDPILSAVQSAADTLQGAVKVADMRAWRWRRRWNECLAEACRLVLADAGCDMEPLARIRRMAADLAVIPLPKGLRKRRMRLPAAFRVQDMAHQDVIALIERFLV